MQVQDDIRHGRSVVYALSAHLVFVTKYRRGVITDRVREHLKATCAEVCRKMGANMREFDGEDDHIHLLVDYPPKVAISRLVNSLKLVSARLLRKRDFPEVRRRAMGRPFLGSILLCRFHRRGQPRGRQTLHPATARSRAASALDPA